MVDVFDALADANRRKILELVASESRTSAVLAKETKLASATLEKHLKMLVGAELLIVETKGKTSTYSLNKDGFAVAGKWFGKFGSAFVSGQADILGENIGTLVASAVTWLEKRVGAAIDQDFDAEAAGKEFGKKLSNAKRDATTKLGGVKVKVTTRKTSTAKPAAKKTVAKKAPVKKAPVRRTKP